MITNQWGMFLGNICTRGSGSLGLLGGLEGTTGSVGSVALEFASRATKGEGWDLAWAAACWWGIVLGGEAGSLGRLVSQLGGLGRTGI